MMIRLIPVAQSLANQRTAIASAQPSLYHIQSILNESEEQREDLNKGKKFKVLSVGISIRNLTYAYPNSKVNV